MARNYLTRSDDTRNQQPQSDYTHNQQTDTKIADANDRVSHRVSDGTSDRTSGRASHRVSDLTFYRNSDRASHRTSDFGSRRSDGTRETDVRRRLGRALGQPLRREPGQSFLRKTGIMAAVVLAGTMTLAGCGQTATYAPNATQTQPAAATNVQRVVSHSYNASTQTVYITVRPAGNPTGSNAQSKTGTGTVEDLINTNDPAALANFATAMYPTDTVRFVHVTYEGSGATGAGTGAAYAGQAGAEASGTTGKSAASIGDLAAAAAAGTSKYVETNHGWVSYHSAPRLHSKILGKLRLGDKAPLVRKANKWWYEIRWHNRNVYITTNSKFTHVATIAGADSTGGTAAGAATNATQYVETNHGWVSYHSQAGLHSKILGRLHLGDKARLIKKANKWWYEIRWKGRNVYITTNSKFTHVVTQKGTAGTSKTVAVPKNIQQPVTATPSQTSGTARIKLPPPGVHWASLTPKAGRNASVQAKTNAVLSVARSKIGTKYIWGHNEDRGQKGFDCSNYTAYVYHHALNYKFTTASRGQYRNVGKTVPRSAMKPGDLLIFEKGKHVGIYAGNNRMIQEGGGLGKCGYLGLGPNSYWGKHMTAVRRMY